MGANMLSPTEEIKAKIDIVDLAREYLPSLKQAGANWKANCPFHNEKTPSFMISRDKQIWHCFGCGEGGDIFEFIKKIEGLEFPEALRLLATKAGVVLERQDPALTSQRNRLLDLCELAAKYYHKVLLDSPVALTARNYLEKRGVDAITIDDWLLGYAPDSYDGLSNFLKKKGFTDNEIFLAGMSVKKDRGIGFYDRFRGRLIFPIRDHHGHIIGFTARSLDPEVKEAKYINTPQTMIYNKGAILYGLDKAKTAIRAEKTTVIVEGNMDVITSHQFGVKNVIASSGTALTPDQVKIIKRYTENLAVAFDADAAGQLAVERGVSVALEEGLNVKVIDLAGGKDPDEIIRREGAARWQEFINSALPIMEHFFQKTAGEVDLNSSDGKKIMVKKMVPFIMKIANKVEQTHWVQKIAEAVKVKEEIIWEMVIQSRSKSRSTPASQITTGVSIKEATVSENELRKSERLLAVAARFPQYLEYVFEHVVPEMLAGAEWPPLYTDLIISYNKEANFDWAQFLSQYPQYKSLIGRLSMLIDAEYPAEFSEIDAKNEISAIIKILKKNYILRQLATIEEQLRQSEIKKDEEATKELAQKFGELASQLAKFD